MKVGIEREVKRIGEIHKTLKGVFYKHLFYKLQLLEISYVFYKPKYI